LNRLLSILIVAICLLNVARVEAHNLDHQMGLQTGDIHTPISLKSSSSLNAFTSDSLCSSHDSEKDDGDCSSDLRGHNCHLGHCSFVLANIFLFRLPAFKIIRMTPGNSSYSGGIVRQVQKPPQA